MPRQPKGQVRQRKNGRWEITIPLGHDPRDHSRRRRSKSLPATASRADAEALRDRLLAEALKERDRSARNTVAGLLEDYFTMFSPAWSPNTVRETRRIIDSYITPRLGKKQTARLTTAALDDFYRALRTSGGAKRRPLADSSVKRIHNVIRPALELAVRHKELPENPAKIAYYGAVDEIEPDPPTPEEAQVLLAAAELSGPPKNPKTPEFGLYVLLSAVMGARRGELCGLLRDTIDADAGTIAVRRVVVYGPKGLELRERTKTKRRRIVPLDDETLTAVLEHMKRMEGRSGHRLPRTAYLFSDDLDCAKPWWPSTQTRRFIKLRRELGLDHVRLHDLRHFAGTQMIALGVDLRTAMDRLGHSQIATTQRYAHGVPQAQRDAADKLGALVRRAG